MRIIGHRGAAAVEVENTLAAIVRAFADAADAVEIDVRLTADGRLVIIHDPTPAGDHRTVASMTWAALHEVAPHVPELDDAWTASGGRVNLEIKGAWGSDEGSRVADALVAWLSTKDCSNVIVSSFDLIALGRVRSALPSLTTGVLTAAGFDVATNIAAAVEHGHQICLLPGALSDPVSIYAVHAAGKVVIPWTVNDPGLLRMLFEAGADGVITDDPGAARAALQNA